MKLRLKKFSFYLQTAQLSWDKRGIFLPYQHMLPFRMATSFEKQFNTYIEVRMVANKTTLPTSMPRSLGKRKLHKVKICESVAYKREFATGLSIFVHSSDLFEPYY